MYTFTSTKTIDADARRVWEVWTDLDRFPSWDPREVRTKLNGPFTVGSTIDSKQRGNPGGTATITEIDPGSRWAATSPLPGGALVIDHIITTQESGKVSVSKRYDVTGPLTLLFRLYYGPRVRRALPASFAALEREANRRA